MEWHESNDRYLGFVDGTFLYGVSKDDNGWYWEHVSDMDGMDGYDTAEEAMADAERDYIAHEFEIDLEEDDLIDFAEVEEVYWDEVAHERLEIAKFGIW